MKKIYVPVAQQYPPFAKSNVSAQWAVLTCTMEKQKQKEMSNWKRNIITKELVTDMLMVTLLAIAIILLALVL